MVPEGRDSQGTYAKVKYGQHVDTNEPVAIKILDKEQLQALGMEDQIKREIYILKQLQHPNIVDLKEVLASKSSIFMVMELVPGGELFEHILLNGALKEVDAQKVFRQLLNGLEYCHMHKIYHRDLKAENVLLGVDGKVKLSDFGLGALPSSERENGLLATTCGTPNYIAPEVLMRRGYAGGPADIWSLGVLLYVIASGKLPFEEMHLSTLFKKISQADYKKPPWFSRPLSSLLGLMLQPDPSLRADFKTIRKHPWVQSEEAAVSSGRLKCVPASADVFQQAAPPRDLTIAEMAALNAEQKQEARPPATMNAFELMNSALDISAIFERRADVVSRATRFTSRASAAEISERLEAAAQKMHEGRAKLKDSSRLRLTALSSKGAATANVEIIPVLPGVHMVEFSKASGTTLAFHQLFKALMDDEGCQAVIYDR